MLAGLSYGALVARCYAAEFPGEVAGLVLIDHAFLDPASSPARARPGAPVLISQTPIVLTMEDVSNFASLPARARELHRWADSLHPPIPSAEDARHCSILVEGKKLGAKPLIVVSTANDDRNYVALQGKLLGLSTKSQQLIAKKSFHAVQIDEPDIVIRAIRIVIDGARAAPVRAGLK